MNNWPAWHNSNFCQVKDLALSIFDLGVIHSDATYEVMAVRHGRVLQLHHHLTRLENSCRGWRLDLPFSRSELTQVISQLYYQSGLENAFVWLVVTRGVPTSGNPRDLRSCVPEVFVYIKPYYSLVANSSITLCLSNVEKTPTTSVPQYWKNWAWPDLTQAQWQAIDRGFDSAVLLDHRGFLTEGPGFNVVVVSKDTVLFPKNNVLPGVTTYLVQQLCDAHAINYKYTDIDINTIKQASDMFVTSTSGDITPVAQFESQYFSQSSQQYVLRRLIKQSWNLDGYSTLLPVF